MKSTASDALISAENTAARPIAPTTGGSRWIRIIGSALFVRRQLRKPAARDDAEQRRHDRIGEQSERVQADAEAHRAIVAGAEHLLEQPG